MTEQPKPKHVFRCSLSQDGVLVDMEIPCEDFRIDDGTISFFGEGHAIILTIGTHGLLYGTWDGHASAYHIDIDRRLK